MKTKGAINKGMRKAKETIDGRLSVKLPANIACRVTYYCEKHNLNRTHFITKIIDERMDELDITEYQECTKDELISTCVYQQKIIRNMSIHIGRCMEYR